MRRYPLAGRPRRFVGLILAALLVVACVSDGPAATAAFPAAGVTITTASGETLAFEPAETTVQAGRPVVIMFRNGSSLQHNLSFTGGLTAATRTIVDPGTTDRLLLAAPAPGIYRFVCTIHDGMAGTMIVQAAVSVSTRSPS